jgi:hypothetical protein
MSLPRQQFNASLTPWHITFGTYGTRLHGGLAPTVDKKHNRRGEAFLPRNLDRVASEQDRMKFPARYFTIEQRLFVEAELPNICTRGGWGYRICAAEPDHVHLLCDVVPAVHGEKVRRLVKRWLGQSLSARWARSNGATWWAEEGSNIAVHDDRYLNNCYAYIHRQRATPPASRVARNSPWRGVSAPD